MKKINKSRKKEVYLATKKTNLITKEKVHERILEKKIIDSKKRKKENY